MQRSFYSIELMFGWRLNIVGNVCFTPGAARIIEKPFFFWRKEILKLTGKIVIEEVGENS
jgi:hypothetical protein